MRGLAIIMGFVGMLALIEGEESLALIKGGVLLAAAAVLFAVDCISDALSENKEEEK